MSTPPQYASMPQTVKAPERFPAVYEIPSSAILEGLWARGRLLLRVATRSEGTAALRLDPTNLRGVIEFLQQLEASRVDE